MRKATSFAWLFAVLVCSPALGQDWAGKMFPVKRHNFGTIAQSAKAVYEFPIENLTNQDIHIASVRSSCGCTSPSIKNNHRTLKPGEKGAILASINSATFSGNRGATLTVTIDRPRWSEVQLQVSVLIRSDVALEPGSVQFGALDQGTPAEKRLQVSFPGRSDLRLLEVKCADPHVSAKATRGARGTYQLSVRLDESAPAGYIHEYLTLVTNDRQSSQIPVLVEGQVVSGIAVSPNWLLMGVVRPGERVTKQIVVRSKQPFVIKRVTCGADGFVCNLPAAQQPKQIQIVPITFVAGNQQGKVSQTIHIETDLSGLEGQFIAEAVVSEAGVALVQHNEPAPDTTVKNHPSPTGR
jgi:hypothetical protein